LSQQNLFLAARNRRNACGIELRGITGFLGGKKKGMPGLKGDWGGKSSGTKVGGVKGHTRNTAP